MLACAVTRNCCTVPFACRARCRCDQVPPFVFGERRGGRDDGRKEQSVFDLAHEVVLRQVGVPWRVECDVTAARAVQVGEQVARDDERPGTQIAGTGIRKYRGERPRRSFLHKIINVVLVDAHRREVAT